jgi:hypothetical protein
MPPVLYGEFSRHGGGFIGAAVKAKAHYKKQESGKQHS